MNNQSYNVTLAETAVVLARLRDFYQEAVIAFEQTTTSLDKEVYEQALEACTHIDDLIVAHERMTRARRRIR